MNTCDKLNLEWIPNAYAVGKKDGKEEVASKKRVAPIIKSIDLYQTKKKSKTK